MRNQLDELYEKEFNYPKLRTLRSDNAKFGYKAVIILLGVVALAATWAGLNF